MLTNQCTTFPTAAWTPKSYLLCVDNPTAVRFRLNRHSVHGTLLIPSSVHAAGSISKKTRREPPCKARVRRLTGKGGVAFTPICSTLPAGVGPPTFATTLRLPQVAECSASGSFRYGRLSRQILICCVAFGTLGRFEYGQLSRRLFLQFSCQ